MTILDIYVNICVPLDSNLPDFILKLETDAQLWDLLQVDTSLDHKVSQFDWFTRQTVKIL